MTRPGMYMYDGSGNIQPLLSLQEVGSEGRGPPDSGPALRLHVLTHFTFMAGQGSYLSGLPLGS